MEDFLGVVFALSALLAVLTVVGHSIWLFFAMIFQIRQFFLAIRNGTNMDLSISRQRPSPAHPPFRSPTFVTISLYCTRCGEITTEVFEQFLVLLDTSAQNLQSPAAGIAPTELSEEFVAAADDKPPAIAGLNAPVPPPQGRPSPQSQGEVHPLDRADNEEPATPVPVPVAPPAQPLSNLLSAFMEDKNIRWGELVAGMLIVISAVGLVISLWATLKDTIPYFPALIFMLVTAAIFGAGMYTLRRWKLESTSRGLLIISMLLIPLNFLAAIALSPEDRIRLPIHCTWWRCRSVCWHLAPWSLPERAR